MKKDLQEREAQRQKNRAEFPKTTEIIDKLNEAFGPLRITEFNREAAIKFEKVSS